MTARRIVAIRVRRADGSIAANYTDVATGRRMAPVWRRAGCRVYRVVRGRAAHGRWYTVGGERV